MNNNKDESFEYYHTAVPIQFKKATLIGRLLRARRLNRELECDLDLKVKTKEWYKLLDIRHEIVRAISEIQILIKNNTLQQWVKVSDELPPDQSPVIVVYKNENGKVITVTASYIESNHRYHQCGWYECNHYHPYDISYIRVKGKVLLWTKLPKLPKLQEK